MQLSHLLLSKQKAFYLFFFPFFVACFGHLLLLTGYPSFFFIFKIVKNISGYVIKRFSAYEIF